MICTALFIGFALISPADAILYQTNDSPYKLLSLPLLDSINSDVFHSTGFTQFEHNIDHVRHLDKYPSFTTSLYPNHPISSSVYLTNGFKPITTVKSPRDLLINDIEALEAYFHNGRFLKQYFVMEDNVDDLNTHNSLDTYVNRFVPFVPSNFNIISASKTPNLGFPTLANPTPSVPTVTGSPGAVPFINPRFTQPSVLINKLTAQFRTRPIQLGSGSLGVLRLPNGAVYLGSGSLGYTNDLQKASEISNVRNRESPGASPLTFGQTP